MNKQSHLRWSLIVSLLFFLVTGYNQVNDWELKTQKGDIKIYTRTTSKSSIKQVRIVTQVKGEINDFMALLGDVPGYQDWVYKSADAKLLKMISDEEFYYYIKSDFPFPLSDRDLVVHSKHWTIPGTDIIQTYSEAYTKPDLYAEQSGVVRIDVFESSWIITPRNNGTIDIDYTILSEPGGRLPTWAINMAISKGPVETMERLKAQMEQRFDLLAKTEQK